MNLKKEPTEKYVVIKPNTLKHKIGDVIDLTNAGSQALVGKVQLVKDMEAVKASANKLDEAEKRADEAEAKVTVLEAELEKLKKHK